jgi:hypothetical protein
MPATVRRAASETGLVLLSSNVQVAADGLITIAARFLAPAAGITAGSFDNDAPWPLAALPTAMPANQGGPYLLDRTIQKANGITTIDAVYVSALNPIRVSKSEASEKLSFAAYKASPISTVAIFGNAGDQELSFDYYTWAQTLTYTLIAPNTAEILPVSRIGHKFNQVNRGNPNLIKLKEEEVVTHNRETVGRVTRISVTSRRYLVEDVAQPDILTAAWDGLAPFNNDIFPSGPWNSIIG